MMLTIEGVYQSEFVKISAKIIEALSMDDSVKTVTPRKVTINQRLELYSIDVTDINGHVDVFYAQHRDETFMYNHEVLTASKFRLVTAIIHTIDRDYADIAVEMLELMKSNRKVINQISENYKKDKAKNELKSIVITGIKNRYKNVLDAFSVKHRGARNFLRYSLKNNMIILEAKLTISDTEKLEKIFEILNENIVIKRK